ncbi:hypothetical protein CZP2022_18 [Vibrio phage C-ZP2022]|nr:hypothetical protein CZP2022_18 [Vibrio phage C-ZP2022]
MKTLTALLSIAFVMFIQDVNAATFPTIALTDAIVCEQLCTSMDAEDKAAEIKEELMQQLTPEQVAKAHALANERVGSSGLVGGSTMATTGIAAGFTSAEFETILNKKAA